MYISLKLLKLKFTKSCKINVMPTIINETTYIYFFWSENFQQNIVLLQRRYRRIKKAKLNFKFFAAVTLNDVINKHIDTLRQTNAALLKPFSLSVFHNLLEVVHTMHEKGWTHRDLHCNQVFL